jgi:hypothetical protein
MKIDIEKAERLRKRILTLTKRLEKLDTVIFKFTRKLKNLQYNLDISKAKHNDIDKEIREHIGWLDANGQILPSFYGFTEETRDKIVEGSQKDYSWGYHQHIFDEEERKACTKRKKE